MTKIVNLDDLVGDDTIIEYEGKQYRLPGDIDVETVFELFHMYVSIGDMGDAKTGDEILAVMRTRLTGIQARLLDLLKQRDPRLAKLPFGIKGTGIVLRLALAELGVQVEAANPTPPPPNRATRRTAAKRKPAAKKTTTRRR